MHLPPGNATQMVASLSHLVHEAIVTDEGQLVLTLTDGTVIWVAEGMVSSPPMRPQGDETLTVDDRGVTWTD